MSESHRRPSSGPSDAVLAEYMLRLDRGEVIDREQFIAEHPEAAEELRDYFRNVDTIHAALSDTKDESQDGQESTISHHPREFGSYVLQEELGSGGMGKVYKAEHRHMGRIVALKTLHAKALDSDEAIARFRREVKAAAKLSHPNIVTSYDAGEVDGVNFLAMEYVEGEDLQSLIRRRGPQGVEQTVDYVLQAARGLEYAHNQGIIHRDVKPSNLVLDKSGTVKILDMGLARVAEWAGNPAGEEESLTHTGIAMGTCEYMAPEQAEDAHRADHRADIYSLGCALYHLLTGKLAYKGSTPIQTLLAHQQTPIPSAT